MYFHGYGIQNMKNTIAKYNGTESMILNEETFELMVNIPVIEISL